MTPRSAAAIASLLLLPVSANAGDWPAPAPADIAWIQSGEFCEPETVLALPDDTLLVSNVCDFRQAGNGFLSLLSADGEVIDWRIVEGLDAPLGMALHNRQLFVVDNNRVKVFGWPAYTLLNTIALDTRVANDLAVAPDGTLYVSDTADGRVVRIAADRSLSTLESATKFSGANGMAWNDGFLFVGGKRLWRVNLDDGTVDTLGPEWLADIDGIEFEQDGTIQVTPVAGPLVRLNDAGVIEILGGAEVSSANHGYAPSLGLALIPTGFDNTVVAIRLPGERQHQ